MISRAVYALCVVAAIMIATAPKSMAQTMQDGVDVERPAASFFMVDLGPASILDTYLSPVENEGVGLRLEYERKQAMRFDPERWIMQMNVGADYASVNNPAGNHVAHSLHADFKWGMMRRWRDVLTPGLGVYVGPSAQFRGGAVYKPTNSNNVVSVRLHCAVNVTAMVSYDLNVKELPITFSYQATLPVMGVFFSPEFGETYYEIYLGNTSGLAHFGWWGNRFDMVNQLSADLHLGRTVLRLGYRNSVERTFVNNLKTRSVMHSAVLGVGGEWLSVGKKATEVNKAKIISSMY